MWKLSTRAPKEAFASSIITLVICVLIQGCVGTTEPPVFNKTETATSYHIQYEWNYRGRRWTATFEITKSDYEYFSRKERTTSYQEYVLNPVDDEPINHLAGVFSEKAEGEDWGEAETVGLVLSFVQSMPYTSDKETTGYDEYPRYPVETIVDGGGDCEDTSILFASIIRAIGYGVVMLELKEDQHIAVGILVSPNLVENWKQHYSLTYYTTQDGDIYAYCETTGWGWELGQKPDALKSQAARIIKIH